MEWKPNTIKQETVMKEVQSVPTFIQMFDLNIEHLRLLLNICSMHETFKRLHMLQNVLNISIHVSNIY